VSGNALDLSGNGLIALIVAIFAILFIAIIVARLVARDRRVKTSRIGVFIERERWDDVEETSGETQEWPHRDP
jgi:hypothetical protein